jgi:hypothetical protein
MDNSIVEINIFLSSISEENLENYFDEFNMHFWESKNKLKFIAEVKVLIEENHSPIKIKLPSKIILQLLTEISNELDLHILEYWKRLFTNYLSREDNYEKISNVFIKVLSQLTKVEIDLLGIINESERKSIQKIDCFKKVDLELFHLENLRRLLLIDDANNRIMSQNHIGPSNLFCLTSLGKEFIKMITKNI